MEIVPFGREKKRTNSRWPILVIIFCVGHHACVDSDAFIAFGGIQCFLYLAVTSTNGSVVLKGFTDGHIPVAAFVKI